MYRHFLIDSKHKVKLVDLTLSELLSLGLLDPEDLDFKLQTFKRSTEYAHFQRSLDDLAEKQRQRFVERMVLKRKKAFIKAMIKKNEKNKKRFILQNEFFIVSMIKLRHEFMEKIFRLEAENAKLKSGLLRHYVELNDLIEHQKLLQEQLDVVRRELQQTLSYWLDSTPALKGLESAHQKHLSDLLMSSYEQVALQYPELFDVESHKTSQEKTNVMLEQVAEQFSRSAESYVKQHELSVDMEQLNASVKTFLPQLHDLKKREINLTEAKATVECEIEKKVLEKEAQENDAAFNENVQKGKSLFLSARKKKNNPEELLAVGQQLELAAKRPRN